MEIRFACKQCGQHIAAETSFTGQKVFCPQCGAGSVIPAVSSLPPRPPNETQDVSFDCHQCGQNITIDDRAAGVKVRCPKCNAALVVPARAAPMTWSLTAATPPDDTDQRERLVTQPGGAAARERLAPPPSSSRSPSLSSPAAPARNGWMTFLALLAGLGLGLVIGVMLAPVVSQYLSRSQPVATSAPAPAVAPDPAAVARPEPTTLSAPPLDLSTLDFGAPADLDPDVDPVVADDPAAKPDPATVDAAPAPADDAVATPDAAAPSATVLRTWTSASGKTLRARLAGVQGTSAILQGENGKRYKIGLADLSDADRALIAEVQPATIEAPAQEPAAADTVRPVRVFILAGQSNMQGFGRITADPNRNGGRGSLEFLANDPATAPKFGRLVDELGQWRARDDVWISLFDRNGPLIPGYGAGRDVYGPELGFGWVMGDALDEPILLIKCAWGGKSLAVDFRPPSAGRPSYSLGANTDAALAADPSILGKYYRETLALTKAALADLENLVPGSNGRYVLSGFGWHQGWNDRINDKFNQEYESNLAHFIRDMRRDLDASGLPFVIAETGMTGPDEKHPRALSLMKAQAAVAERPEFRGNIAFVGTRDFWRPAEQSPSGQGYHWNANAETYYLIGEAMGEAMKRLLGLPSSPRAKTSTPLPAAPAAAAGTDKPVQAYLLFGQSNMLGFGTVAGDRDGTLEHAVRAKGKYPYLVDDRGNWTMRDDVRYVRVMGSGTGPMKQFNNEWLTVSGRAVGPELGIGHALGDAIDAPVLILKSCIGNRSLGWDLLPPGSKQFEEDGLVYAGYKDSPDKWKKGETPAAIGWYAGMQYDGDVANAKTVLAALDRYYPGATAYEVAGFFWWQGDKDRYNAVHADRYEENLVRLIEQLRADFNAPRAKFVCATLGQTRKGAAGNDGKILKAQRAVDGARGKYPQFKGNVATVYTHPLSHGGASNSHYNKHAETYMDVGEAMGQAMVALLNHR